MNSRHYYEFLPQVAGTLLVDLGPAITKMPLMAGLCLYLNEPPVIDFNTTSTAGALDRISRDCIRCTIIITLLELQSLQYLG